MTLDPTAPARVVAHGGVLQASAAAAPVPKAIASLDISGGDGHVTATHDGGGTILRNAHIVLIYWGSAWGNPATNPSQTAFTNAVRGILGGPWGTQLAQYRGIGPITLEQVDLNTSSDPATVFTDPQIQAMIDSRISGGFVPMPAAGVDRIYCVLMPTGHSSGDTPFVGQHQYYDRAGTRVYWAWVTNDGTLTGGNSIPKVFTHEVAEACSDPDLGSGITLTTVGEGDEIGDTCNNTYSTINGVAEEAYWSAADNRCVLPVFRPLPSTAGNPSLVQGKFGTRGNFELVVPEAAAGLYHLFRNNDNGFLPWSVPTPFGTNSGQVDAVSLIQSSFGSPGNLEIIVRMGANLFHFWRDSGPAFQWNGPFAVGSGASGVPSFVQGRFGNPGNFELVTPMAGGGLAHFWREAAPPWTWHGPFAFGQNAGMVDAVSLIESSYGTPGNLEIVARTGGNLFHFWRDSGPAFQWNGPFGVGSGASGNPSLIQGRFGNPGNFELVTPMAGGGLAHFWREAAPPWTWHGPTPFGQNAGAVSAATMIESNFGTPGNLEVVVQVGGGLSFFWRDSGPAFQWNGPFTIQSTLW